MACVDANGRAAPCQKPLSILQMLRYAYQAGFRGNDLLSIVQIAMAESYSGIPNAANGDALGILQIKPSAWASAGATSSNVLDPAQAFKIAFDIHQKQGFCPWQTYSGQGCSGGGYTNGMGQFLGQVALVLKANQATLGITPPAAGGGPVNWAGGVAGSAGNAIGGVAGAAGNAIGAVTDIPGAIGDAVSTILIRGGLIVAGLVAAVVGVLLLAEDEKSRQLRSIFAGGGRSSSSGGTQSGGAPPAVAAAEEAE